ncbi:MAG TPA: PaaI family thioesterase [Acidimicrobiales bacterium]|nr:PaaI family thioesterase [Acidimicrobiales bacterium]
MPSTPYLKSLGIVMEVFEPDHARIRLPFREDLTNDGAVYHGGVIAAVLDTAGAAAAWSNHDFDKGARASTVSMTVQYLGACKRSDLVCDGRALRRGRELIFCEMTATGADGNLVANGVLTYRIV